MYALLLELKNEHLYTALSLMLVIEFPDPPSPCNAFSGDLVSHPTMVGNRMYVM